VGVTGRRIVRALGNGSCTPGAVVIGGDYQGLGIVRSLGRRGIDVLVIDDERSISRYSRYATAAIRVSDLREEETTVATLLETGARYGLDGWVVFPTREETVAAVSRHRERLGSIFRIPTPAWDVVRWAWDKRRTYEIAQTLGIATPRTWLVRGEDELARVDGEPPYAIKPAIKEHFLYATGSKAWRADNRAELTERFRAAERLVGAEEVMIQELIPGTGEAQLAYCAFVRDGGPVASMVARRLRQHPPLFGRATTFVQTIEHPELEHLSRRFLQAIGYYGLVELEYKHDRRDGKTKLLDVNARTWGYHSLGQRAGVDFPYLQYADQVGAPPPHELRAPPGVSWMRLVTDVPTCALELARGELDLRTYVRSLRAADVEAVLSLDDPLPGLAELALVPYLAVTRGL
jgi:D-aspartate ligase